MSIGSPIHNHSGSECFMKVLEGKLLESRYYMPNTTENTAQLNSIENNNNNNPSCETTPKTCYLTVKEKNCLTAGSIAYINDTIGLHKVENIYSEPAITLHLYMPPYDSCSCFSEETGHIVNSFTTFYSEHGEKVTTN